jgi:hypothetical protein
LIDRAAAKRKNRFRLSGLAEKWGKAARNEFGVGNNQLSNALECSLEGSGLVCAEKRVFVLPRWMCCG